MTELNILFDLKELTASETVEGTKGIEMNIFNMFAAEFFKHMIFGADPDEEFVRRHDEQCRQYRRYLEDGIRPTNMKCVYDNNGEMIWNEVTGCCGPATWIP